jgi:bifunctional non-homologous end joining protein LigD
VEVSRVRFIPPALPKLRASPPIGEGWLYELKFDGYRVQLHKDGLSSAIFGRNGRDFAASRRSLRPSWDSRRSRASSTAS